MSRKSRHFVPGSSQSTAPLESRQLLSQAGIHYAIDLPSRYPVASQPQGAIDVEVTRSDRRAPSQVQIAAIAPVDSNPEDPATTGRPSNTPPPPEPRTIRFERGQDRAFIRIPIDPAAQPGQPLQLTLSGLRDGDTVENQRVTLSPNQDIEQPEVDRASALVYRGKILAYRLRLNESLAPESVSQLRNFRIEARDIKDNVVRYFVPFQSSKTLESRGYIDLKSIRYEPHSRSISLIPKRPQPAMNSVYEVSGLFANNYPVNKNVPQDPAGNPLKSFITKVRHFERITIPKS
jgi:hypothetical protein